MLESECQRHDNNHNNNNGDISLIPCVMVPSLKNQKAANMIGLDWSSYENNFYEFIEQIRELGINEILLTSPNSFDEGINVLEKISN